MTTSLDTDQQEKDPPDLQPDDLILVVPKASAATQSSPRLSDYYLQEEESEEDDERAMSTPLVTPFQFSTGHPVLPAEPPSASGPSASPVRRKTKMGTRLRSLRIALLVVPLLAVLGFLWMTVFAQPAQPLVTAPAPAPTTTKVVPQGPAGNALGGQTPSAATGPTAAPNGPWIPQHLPAGWTDAELTKGDAVFAERTAWAFTDREEGLDYRNIGTQAQHAGTMTAAAFLLTDAGKVRYAHNDVRVANNVLFNKITQTQLIAAAVNAIPSLVAFQVQGNQQFAWVDVSYQLFQSQLDPTTGQRMEGLEMDPATHMPRLHHMSVLLFRVTPSKQGANAPMGGSGWLVSNYALDAPNGALLDILEPA